MNSPTPQFAPGSWDDIQRDVGWRPSAADCTKKSKQQLAEEEEAKKIADLMQQIRELHALEEKTRSLNQRVKEWKKWTL